MIKLIHFKWVNDLVGKLYLYETVMKILGCATFVSYDPEQMTRFSLFSLSFLASVSWYN